MILHRPLDPETSTTAVRGWTSSPFDSTWTRTAQLLQREANYLGLSDYDRRRGLEVDLYIEVDVPHHAIRQDGQISARAPRFASDVIAVEILTLEHGTLRMVSAKYGDWQSNVHAVALTLDALRAVDRWGAAEGHQYRGFAALGSGMPMGAGSEPMTVAIAARLLCDATADTIGEDPTDLARIRAVAQSLYREACKTHHPDKGGDPAVLAQLTEARDRLVA